MISYTGAQGNISLPGGTGPGQSTPTGNYFILSNSRKDELSQCTDDSLKLSDTPPCNEDSRVKIRELPTTVEGATSGLGDSGYSCHPALASSTTASAACCPLLELMLSATGMKFFFFLFFSQKIYLLGSYDVFRCVCVCVCV